MGDSKKKGSGAVLAALFGAVTSAACFIQIPLPGGIPIVLQDMMAMLSGLLLGPVYGTIAVFIFLVLGSIGLPVFSGKAGFHVISHGVTGGFLIGYMVSAFIGGLILALFLSPKKEHSQVKQWILIFVAALVATVVCFALGIAGFIRVTHKTMDATLKAVVVPFIPGNTIKLILMTLLAKKFRPIVQGAIA